LSARRFWLAIPSLLAGEQYCSLASKG
jgi:hypothetical protein